MSGGAAPEPRRTSPLGVVVGATSDIRKSLVPAAAGAYGLRDQFGGIGFIAAFAVLLLVIGGIGSVLKWWRTTYLVGPEDIRLETGVIRRAARSVSYERIQDVSLEQPLLARIFGLAQVRFETGAGGADEINLAYLPLAEAERLRELVRDRREGEACAQPSDEPLAETAAQKEQVLFAMSPRRLALLGLFEFSLAAVAMLAGATQQFEFLLPFDIWDWREWRGQLGVPVDKLRQLGPLAQAAGIALALVLLAVVGVVTGLARTLAREWGFVLERTAKGFRRRRGLFTRSDVVMPAHRVQGLQLRTGVLRRWWGWHALKFVSLAQDAGASSHIVAPFARLGEIAPIAEAAGFALPDEATRWVRPARRAFLDAALLGIIAPMIAVAGLLLSPVPQAAPFPLLAIPLIGLSQALRWHRARHALDSAQVYVRRGWLAPRTDIASQVKLQSIEIVQGPIARRRGYATVHLGLAGGTMELVALPMIEARALRDTLLAEMTALDFSKIA